MNAGATLTSVAARGKFRTVPHRRAAAPPIRPTFCLYAATQDNAFLVTKTCARLGKRLDLYRFWVMLLHLKGVRFSASSR